MNAVCMPDPWTVDTATSPGRWMLTGRSPGAGSAIATGSLSALAPGAIVTDARPSKVTGWSVPAWIRAAPACTARRTGPIVTGAVPYRLDRRSRTPDPAMLVRTTWRMVCAFSAGPVESGTAVQTGTQAPSDTGCASVRGALTCTAGRDAVPG